MKSIKEIENMSLEQLEAVSMDESIAVPDGFTSRIEGRLENRKSRVRVVRFVAAVASVAVLAGVGLSIAKWQEEPKDTFDDPYLAYAEIQKAFATISTSINKSLAMAGETEQVIEKATSVFSEK